MCEICALIRADEEHCAAAQVARFPGDGGFRLSGALEKSRRTACPSSIRDSLTLLVPIELGPGPIISIVARWGANSPLSKRIREKFIGTFP